MSRAVGRTGLGPRRIGGVATALFLLASPGTSGAGGGPASTLQATSAAPRGSIVFERWRGAFEGRPVLHVVRPDGRRLRRLGRGLRAREPRFSPNARRVAALSAVAGVRPLFVVNRRGRGRRTLVPRQSRHLDPGGYQWAPSSQAIAFTGPLEESFDRDRLYTVGVPGGRLRSFGRNDFRIMSTPSWSPESNRIAVGVNRLAGEGSVSGVWVFDAATGAAVPLVEEPVPEAGGLIVLDVTEVAWSPNGRRIAVARNDAADRAELLLLDYPSGRTVRRLRSPGRGSRFTGLRWSPNSRRLAYGRTLRPGGTALKGDLFTIGARRGAPRNLTRAARAEKEPYVPAWSPDGRRIAFSLRGDIYTSRPDGRGRRRVTRGRRYDVAPHWGRR